VKLIWCGMVCSLQINISNDNDTWLTNWTVTKIQIRVKVKVWALAIAPLTWVRLVTSSALQSQKWQLIGMSQWCRSALCGHPLPALTDNWTHGAASRHTIAPISHTRPSPRSRNYYSFPVPLRVWGWVGLSISLYLKLCTKTFKTHHIRTHHNYTASVCETSPHAA